MFTPVYSDLNGIHIYPGGRMIHPYIYIFYTVDFLLLCNIYKPMFREELWLAKGVRLDRRDREIIKENANKVGIISYLF